MSHIAYVDDCVENLEVYKMFFETVGLKTTVYSSPFDLLREQNFKFDAMLIDVNMPHLCGITLYQQVINQSKYNHCPVLFISGEYNEYARIKAFEMGAADFIDRMSKLSEIAARIKNRIARSKNIVKTEVYGNLTLDLENILVKINDEEVPLTFIELKILARIVKSSSIVTKIELIKKIWGDPPPTDSTFLTHIKNLNQKLQYWDHEIVSVKSVGYFIKPKNTEEIIPSQLEGKILIPR